MPLPPLEDYAPPAGPLAIAFADADVVVVDKPAGMLSVPGKDPAHQICVQSRLAAQYPDSLLVHRLDMDTSGVMIFARNKPAQRHLGLQFERRHMRKIYVAVLGENAARPLAISGRVDLPMIADWPNRPLQKICADTGKSAVTRWRCLSGSGAKRRVMLMPKTGRSHQLRLHCQSLGAPIIGDRFYGGDPASRLMLHALRLTFWHPTEGRKISVTIPPPGDFDAD